MKVKLLRKVPAATRNKKETPEYSGVHGISLRCMRWPPIVVRRVAFGNHGIYAFADNAAYSYEAPNRSQRRNQRTEGFSRGHLKQPYEPKEDSPEEQRFEFIGGNGITMNPAPKPECEFFPRSHRFVHQIAFWSVSLKRDDVTHRENSFLLE